MLTRDPFAVANLVLFYLLDYVQCYFFDNFHVYYRIDVRGSVFTYHKMNWLDSRLSYYWHMQAVVERKASNAYKPNHQHLV